MASTIEDLKKNGYKGYSVRHILMNQEFRKRVLNDPSVRGNEDAKNLTMDKLAVGGKVLITGPTGEAKTLFSRVLLEHIVREINNNKYHIAECPFLEDAGYVIDVVDQFEEDPFSGIRVLQSLCPFCRKKIEEVLSEDEEVKLDNTSSILKIKPATFVERLQKLPVEKTIVRKAQLDPRTDPESLYMLLAGVENLEELFGKETTTTYAATSHKVGVLSQGFMVVNEIQRLPLALLEALMGFLEDTTSIKYNLQGEPVYIDGAIIFTSNAPLTVFGEESQPIINRIPEVLWPARSVESRSQIVRDMFEEQITLSRQRITANPAIVQLHGREKSIRDYVSKLAIDFLSFVGNNSLPEALKRGRIRSESRVQRLDFYAGLDEIHDPQRNPHIDLRTTSNIVGGVLLNRTREMAEEKYNVITIEHVRKVMADYDIPVSIINDALQEIKIQLRSSIKESDIALKADDISEDISKMKALSDEELTELITAYEGLERYYEPDELKEVVELLKPSYEALLKVDYI
ncbi:MAG: hypothetical protein ACTSQE_09885 [Candidatus Heimdallarchaeaceae archaeon]